jgi:hypothetical protein
MNLYVNVKFFDWTNAVDGDRRSSRDLESPLAVGLLLEPIGEQA